MAALSSSAETISWPDFEFEPGMLFSASCKSGGFSCLTGLRTRSGIDFSRRNGMAIRVSSNKSGFLRFACCTPEKQH